VRALLALVATLVLPSAALAQTAEVDALREQVQSRRWPQAVRTAEEYLARTDLSAAVRNGVLELLAEAQIGAGDAGAAESILGSILARDPDHRLSDGASAALRAALERARAATPRAVWVELRHETPGALDARGVARLRVELAGARNAVDHVHVFFSPGDRDFRSAAMQTDGSAASMELPADDGARRYGVRYYFEARAPSGAVLARLGTAEQPMWLTAPGGTGSAPPVEPPPAEAPPPPEESPDEDGGSVAGEWWFWTLIGLVVVGGGAVGAYFLFGPPSQEELPNGTLGNVELLRFP
jgi:hypothetical protein